MSDDIKANYEFLISVLRLIANNRDQDEPLNLFDIEAEAAMALIQLNISVTEDENN